MNFINDGATLNIHEQSMLRASLSKLQASEKFGRVYFWGKIIGSSRDYFIAYGMRDSEVEFPTKQFYCATDEKFEFGDLPLLTEEEVKRIEDFPKDSHFKGEPDSNLFEAGEDEEPVEENPDEPKLTELHRLSYTVQMLDFDCSVVPAAAWILTDAHKVSPTPDFRGLSYNELSDLSSYAHFRPPENFAKLRAMARNDAEWKSSNFLDRITGDLPKGCWTHRMSAGTSSVLLRSLSWPGYSFYAVADKGYYASCYIGHGIKNHDLPFLLP